MKKLNLIIVLLLCTQVFGQELVQEFYENGNVSSEGDMHNGIRVGKWKTYYDTGELMVELIFRDGLVNGNIVEYHKNGNIKTVGQRRNGKNEGEFLIYSYDGNLFSKINFEDDIWHGEYEFYYPHGGLREKGRFFEGKRKGMVRFYDVNGEISDERLYEGNEKSPEEIMREQVFGRMKELTKDILGPNDSSQFEYVGNENEFYSDNRGIKKFVSWFKKALKFSEFMTSPLYNWLIGPLLFALFYGLFRFFRK